MAWSGELLECNGEADHVHLLLSLPPHSSALRLRQRAQDWNLATAARRIRGGCKAALLEACAMEPFLVRAKCWRRAAIRT